MKHIFIGDVHGYHNNLRKYLTKLNVINKKGVAINRDEYKVYCTGDLMDGNVNRQGDLLNLEFAPEWFDKVILGNHEMAFFGGYEFTSRRKHDRKVINLMLDLMDKGIYVPAIYVPSEGGDWLATHCGFAKEFVFTTAKDAYEFIMAMWEVAPSFDDTIPVFDWQGAARGYYSSCDVTGGIFQLDWSEDRNPYFNQVVGHSSHYDGPLVRHYPNHVQHWDVDVGGKQGKGLGSIILDDVTGNVEKSFWGERYFKTSSVTTYNKNTGVTSSTNKGYSTYYCPDCKTNVEMGKDHYKHCPAKEAERRLSGDYKLGKSTLKSPQDVAQRFTTLPLVDLDEIDIQVIDDPEILAVYKSEVERGSNMKLRDLLH